MSPRLRAPERQAFYARVWQVVRQIPAGRVATYGQIATLVSPPQGVSAEEYRAWGARWVGGAMAACPQDVPWQRVLNAQGKISLPEQRGGLKQRRLLEAEGVPFDEKGLVDLQRFGWTPPLPD